jgi:hypothetical protein
MQVVSIPSKSGHVETYTVNDTTFRIKKVRHGVYSLHASNVHNRCRFGNLEEIRTDINHTLEFGTLPPPSSYGF